MDFDKELVKQKIQELVEKYETAKEAGRLRSYSEEETKKDFILPLFRALGWNIEEKKEVSAEEYIKSSGRVDYGFYLNSRSKFYLEAKPLSADLYNEKYANQAIKYSWNKSVTWAILTDFENIKVFNAQVIDKALMDKQLFDISYSEFLNRFDDLWLLSRKSFETDELDKYAEKIGKKIQKISVTKKLYEDLNNARLLLTKMFLAWNSELQNKKHLVDEGVQKVLDRIMFIRVAEDRSIEQPTLRPLIREWQVRWNSGKKDKLLYQYMIDKFTELNDVYNSHIFSKHPSDTWKEHGNKIKEIRETLYGKEDYYEYDFKVMPADVLGTVYEQYLGHRLLQSLQGDLFDTKDLKLAKDVRKRKEQGIYYTPSFIVDHIVEQALGPVLERCKTITDLQKIKILDPACGSGSFLVKAFELIYKKYEEFNTEGQAVKLQILINNLYGVDLDEQAVEISKLNLLLSALEERRKLPDLTNIKNGNSLISGTDEEMEKQFGKNWRDEKPFNWLEEFPEVFKQGGFDVIIGNPPYVTTKYGKISDFSKKFFIQNFECAYDKLDLYILFIEKAIKILKEHGFVSFITPWNFLANFYSFKIRKFLLDNTKIKLLYKLSPNTFDGVIVDNVIFVLEKDKDNKNNEILLDDFLDKKNQKRIKQNTYLNNEKYVFTISSNDVADKILGKMKLQSKKLGDIALNYIGIMTGGQKEMIANNPIFKNSKPVLSGRDIDKWTYLNRGNFVNFDKSKIHSNDNEKIYLSEKKILLRKTGRDFVACLDINQFYTIQSLYNIVVKDKEYVEEYLLSLLNSKLFTYIYNKFFITNPEVFPYIKRRSLDQLPIKILFKDQQKIFIKLSDKMLELHKKLEEMSEHSNEWENIKSEIEKTDKKIDEEVYKLYGLESDEIEIVENSSKK